MKKLLFSFLSPFSPWLAFQTVLVLLQSFMLVCMPSQPCRWCPVQPVEFKSSLSVCVRTRPCVHAHVRACVCVQVCLWECLFVVKTSPMGSDLLTELRITLQDNIVYKCYIISQYLWSSALIGGESHKPPTGFTFCLLKIHKISF